MYCWSKTKTKNRIALFWKFLGLAFSDFAVGDGSFDEFVDGVIAEKKINRMTPHARLGTAPVIESDRNMLAGSLDRLQNAAALVNVGRHRFLREHSH
jgi:hypothetical protein